MIRVISILIAMLAAVVAAAGVQYPSGAKAFSVRDNAVAYFQRVSSAAGTGTSTQLQRSLVRRYTGAGHVIDNDSVQMTRFPGGYFSRGGSAYYYLTDYQGNNIAVVDAAGSITQRTDYYPYGEPWRYPDGQPYLYSDKEITRADGRHAYTFPARTLLPSLPRWTTTDPHSESYYSVSPYSYCAANPIMAIDPFGCDSISINEQGQYIGSIKSTENDTFIIKNSQGDVINKKTFEYGTLVSITNTEYQDQKISIYNVNNDNNGIELFEFLADNTNVEWSLFQTGSEADGDNYITTSNNEHSDYGTKYLPYYYFTNFRSCIHNHPSNTAVPSPADISYAGWITKYFGWNISLGIYLPLYGRYIYYGPYSKKEDFEDATFRQIINTIVVEPK